MYMLVILGQLLRPNYPYTISVAKYKHILLNWLNIPCISEARIRSRHIVNVIVNLMP